jgi:hypothetical protein
MIVSPDAALLAISHLPDVSAGCPAFNRDQMAGLGDLLDQPCSDEPR